MALSGESLSSATTTGPGTAIMFDEPRTIVAQVTWTGTGNINVAFEGTLDGTNWAIFQQWSGTISGSNTPGSYLLSNNGSQPVMGVRADLTLIAATASVSVFLSASEF